MGNHENTYSEELRVFSKIGGALWVDPSETLAAATLKRQSFEQTLESATRGLLENARRQGRATFSKLKSEHLSELFFHLTPEERFVLVALHRGKWSYQRLSRILKQSVDEVQELAWSARLQLCSAKVYPSGPSTMGSECPTYDPIKPWTQRFLDQEIHSRRDLFFLQSHLINCTSCAKALARCREHYYRVSQEVSKQISHSSEPSHLEDVLYNSPYSRFPSELTWSRSFKTFWGHSSTKALLFSLFALTLLKMLHWVK